MTEKLSIILNRVESRHFARLWTFYRDHFTSDEVCLDFLASALCREPEKDVVYDNMFDAAMDESIFIPRRMVNAVMRFVSAARDMEQIRPGKDIFKIIYLITCIEILQNLAGNDSPKGKKVVSFFVDNISKKDSAIILKKFRRSLGDLTFEDTMSSIEEFASVLNELRNSAAHEGDFWGVCFNNGYSNYPLMFSVDIDLKAFSRHNKTSHTFETTLDYGEFEDIFVRICLTFIRNYIASQDKDSW